MRKDYIKPEAEMVKFVEEEDLMTELNPEMGVKSWNFADLNQSAL